VAVRAGLEELRALVGAKASNDDGQLSAALDAAVAHVRPLVMADRWDGSDVQHAVLLLANRLHQRRHSATGVEGFGPEGFSVRVLASDPDIAALLAPALDMCKAGVA
jgi:hypothetical protein